MAGERKVAAIEQAVDWVRRMQDPRGGWSQFRAPRATTIISKVSIMGTAEALLSLSFGRGVPEDTLLRGLTWLCQALLGENKEVHCHLTRHYAVGGLALWTYYRKFPIVGGGKYEIRKCLEIGTEWLIKAQNLENGGWGHTYVEGDGQNAEVRYPSKTSATFMAIRFLTSLPAELRDDRCDLAIERGKNYLLQACQQQPPQWGFDYQQAPDPASTAFALIALKGCGAHVNGLSSTLAYLREYASKESKLLYLEETEMGGDLEDEYGHMWAAWVVVALLMWGSSLEDPTVVSCLNGVLELQRLEKGGGFSKARKHRPEVWCTYACLQMLSTFISSFQPDSDLIELVNAYVSAERRVSELEGKLALKEQADKSTSGGFLLGYGVVWMRISWVLGVLFLLLATIVSGVLLMLFAQTPAWGQRIGLADGIVSALASYVLTDQRLKWNKSASIPFSVTLGVFIGGAVTGVAMLMR